MEDGYLEETDVYGIDLDRTESQLIIDLTYEKGEWNVITR